MEVHGMSVARLREMEDETIVSGGINAAGNLVLSRKDGTQVNAGKVVPDPVVIPPVLTRKVQVYTNANASTGITWVKPANATRVRVILIGGGAGGPGPTGSGVGVGGAMIDVTLPASMFNSTETVTVGSGGIGGTGANNGTAGGDATITIKGQLLNARGGGWGGVIPGWPTMSDRTLKLGGPFQTGGGILTDSTLRELFGDAGGGGVGQNDAQYSAGGPGFFGFTRAGVKGTAPGTRGQDGNILEGIAGGGGGIPTDSTPGHGGTPGGGGARGTNSVAGGNGGAAQACIISYYNTDD